jgi:hypothetical protein
MESTINKKKAARKIAALNIVEFNISVR